MVNCDELTKAYIAWISQEVRCEALPTGVRVFDVPFLDRYNDFIRIYVESTAQGLRLSDGGETLRDLFMLDFSLDGHSEMLFRQILNSQKVSHNHSNNSLFVISSAESVAAAVQNLIQAIINVGDLVFVLKPIIPTKFDEAVAEYFHTHEIPFYTSQKVLGSTGNDRKFEFLLYPEDNEYHFVSTVSTPSSQNIDKKVFWIDDVRKNEDAHARSFTILVNDSEQAVSTSGNKSASAYDIPIVTWSQREEMVSHFKR
jgi:hypothetical protein